MLTSVPKLAIGSETSEVAASHIGEIILCKNGLGFLLFLRVVLPLDIAFPTIDLLREMGFLPLDLEGEGVWLRWCHVRC